PICGIERKNVPVSGTHTGCSAPPWASTPCAASKVILFAAVGLVRAQLAGFTVMKVPNGGVSALLMTRSNLSCGSYASSSARLVVGVAVWTSLTGVGGKCVVSKETTRLGASVTNRQCPPVTTPFGPGETAGGDTPAKAGVAASCPRNLLVLALTISSPLLDRSAT